MSFPRSVSDEDLRDDCARVLGKVVSLGATVKIVADDWWTFQAPAHARKACAFELVMAALLIGRGCGVHAKSECLGLQGERLRFGSKRLNEAFCRALRETAAGARA